MKKILIFLLLGILSGCSKDHPCNFPYVNVNRILYTNTPTDNPDLYGGVLKTRGGLRGLIVVKVNEGTYRAYDAACPFHARECDGMRISGVTKAVCECGGEEFMLLSGQPLSTGATISPCGMVEYSTYYDANRGELRIFN